MSIKNQIEAVEQLVAEKDAPSLDILVRDLNARRERCETPSEIPGFDSMTATEREDAVKDAEMEFHSALAEASEALFRYLTEQHPGVVKRAYGALCYSFSQNAKFWESQLDQARWQASDASAKIRAALDAKERPDMDAVSQLKRANGDAKFRKQVFESAQEVFLNVERVYEAVVGEVYAQPKPKGSAAPAEDIEALLAEGESI